MEINANDFLKQLIADEVRLQLTAIRDSALSHKQDSTHSSCTVSWSGGAVAWPQAQVKRDLERVSGKLDNKYIDELLLTVKFK
jgi:hypothetical protein